MTAPRKWIGSLLLNLPAPLRSLRNVPILGNLAHRLSHRILPADEKVWARVERGPGQALWLELNPRTGHQYLHGDVEPAIQEVLAEKLKPGMVFYDLGANIGFFSLLAARLGGVSIVAEVYHDGVASFWGARPELKAQVLNLFAKSGAKAVVAKDVPPALLADGWSQVGATSYFVLVLLSP